MVFPRENPSIFEGERKRPLGNAEVQADIFTGSLAVFIGAAEP